MRYLQIFFSPFIHSRFAHTNVNEMNLKSKIKMRFFNIAVVCMYVTHEVSNPR